MDFNLVNFKLYTICFLDALCVGLILPILANHIFWLRGTHTILGILGTGHATFQLISGPLIRTLRDRFGKKVVLFGTLLVTFATHLPLGITHSYYIIVLLRLIYALTNQTQTLCKAFVPEHNPKEKHDSIYNVTNALTVAGLVVGPIVSGPMYDVKNGFFHVTMLASLMLFLCLLISLTLPSSAPTKTKESKTSFVQKIKEDVQYSLQNLQCVNISEQWDVIVLKYLYHTGITVFFIKFSLLLKIHYQASSTIIGYTYAYQSILTFLSHFVVTILKQKFGRDTTNLVSALFIVTIGFIGLCCASTYDIYLVSFIPMILAHTVLSKNWKELFILRSTEQHNIEKVEETIAKIVSVVTPVIFGVFCDLYGHHALTAFVIVPLIFDILIAIVFTSDNAPIIVVPEKED